MNVEYSSLRMVKRIDFLKMKNKYYRDFMNIFEWGKIILDEDIDSQTKIF